MIRITLEEETGGRFERRRLRTTDDFERAMYKGEVGVFCSLSKKKVWVGHGHTG